VSTGVERIRVGITGVNGDGTAVGQDELGRSRKLQASTRPKGSPPPVAGEIWMAEKVGTRWFLDRLVQHPSPPEVTGSRGDGSALESLLTALSGAGYIQDQTTA
jgi:hypothetical protein